ncbi:MAG TPA: hypothetical protein VF556_06200 [Pyrinomonadaceae bacterium]|jgi:hypothetical protein
MGSTKHEKSFIDYGKPYEQNLIGLRGIIYFSIGLALLIIISFGLMWVLQNVLEDQARESKASNNPMMMNERERLPPEPRLQAAPGFGVDSENGRVNLELRAPQSEYWELRQQWENIWRNGQRHPGTGTVVTLPIEQAKEKYLQQTAGAPAPAAQQQGQNLLLESRLKMSDSSAGRVPSEKIK